MSGAVWRAVAVAGLVAGAGFYADPVSAQTLMSRTWVSGTGFDSNPCTTSQPCQTFAGALAKTASGGEINCLSAGGFGPVTITKSVSIVCDNVEAGIIATTGTNATNPTSAVVVDGAGIVVTLSGLDLDGFGSGVNGVLVNNAASVVLSGIKARNFTGFGVRFAPSAANATLTVTKSLLSGNGVASTVSGGLYAQTAAAARVTISDSQFVNNATDGLRFEPTAGTLSATVIDSMASGNGSTGFRFRTTSGATINGTVNGATLTNNTSFGLTGSGAGVSLNVGDTTVTANGSGVVAGGGALLTTFGDNRIVGNTTNGAFSGSQIKQ